MDLLACGRTFLNQKALPIQDVFFMHLGHARQAFPLLWSIFSNPFYSLPTPAPLAPSLSAVCSVKYLARLDLATRKSHLQDLKRIREKTRINLIS